MSMNSDDVQVTSNQNGNINPADDLNKFTKLCSELECGFSNSYSALDEVLGLKNLLLEQDLPSAVKVKITLAVGRLHRSLSDLSVPTGEITRLVRLYAVPWENKSKALKKLHQDYESKQHQLEIALRRLEMVGVQTMRMERERRILNWEKLFAKLVGGKSHGQRWRFLIRQFKQKLKNGEDLANVYSNMSDNDEEVSDEEEGKVLKKSSSLFAEELRVKLQRFERFPQQNMSSDKVLQNTEQGNKVQRNSFIEEESEASIPIGMSDDNYSAASAEPEQYSTSSALGKKKVRFDNENNGDDDIGDYNEQQTEKEPHVKDHNEISKKNVTVEMEDKDCWTHEPEYEKLFHMRVYKPKCKTLNSSWCTIVFYNELRKTQIYSEKEGKGEMPSEEKISEKSTYDEEEKPIIKSTEAKESDKNEGNSKNVESAKKQDDEEFQELTFRLSPEFETKNKDDVLLKFSIHPPNKKTMIAMTSVKLSDIEVLDEELNTISSATDRKLKPTVLPVKATVNNSELIFNRTCGELQIICYYSKLVLPRYISRGTETLSIEELTNRIIELRRRDFLKRLKSAGTSMSEKPIYTEEQMQAAKEELKEQLKNLRSEYEERLSLMISHLNKENVESLREFVNAATSPLFMWSESKVTEEGMDDPFRDTQLQTVKPSKSRPSRKGTRKSDKKQQVWGENLPEDFYERMEMFKEESFKHHQKLKQKINEEVGKEIEKKLASNNKLDTSSKDGRMSDEICLPALYMPTKTRNLYTPKARSYFHAFGTYDQRLTQPPSILQLPRLRSDNSDIVGIYESVMKQKMENVPDRENDTDLGRFSPESSTSLEIDGIDKGQNEEQV